MCCVVSRVTCHLQDGRTEDFTERLQSYGAHALLFLNIKSYSGGTRPWKQKAGVQSTCDNLVEVVAMDNVDLALLNLGGTGEAICQARSVVIETSRAVPIQVDGEPLLVNPFRLKIEYFNSACMLTKKKSSCEFVIALCQFFKNNLSLDPYKDPEVEEWAARKIQSSFKNYKTQKSSNCLRTDSTT